MRKVNDRSSSRQIGHLSSICNFQHKPPSVSQTPSIIAVNVFLVKPSTRSYLRLRARSQQLDHGEDEQSGVRCPLRHESAGFVFV